MYHVFHFSQYKISFLLNINRHSLVVILSSKIFNMIKNTI